MILTNDPQDCGESNFEYEQGVAKLLAISFIQRKANNGKGGISSPSRPSIYHEKQGIKVLASGWEAFCKANRIQVGDECAFEIEDVSECIYKVNVDRK
ncbi:hypothetical protein LOK49_LG04G02931 [Camellia lanceoleosa]|uniref:Uncharacterized protein n=1 Tax=Camellia lanceoleosa TaxID=1840588 RepID=A0ACC0HU28_9ERIC|nr:hypothetical protein LOK49_LG04G02931 [Camellia lanceoleosa]